MANMTHCMNYDQSGVGCEKCGRYPTLFILAIRIIFLETIKFLQGFVRLATKNKSKQDLNLKPMYQNNSTNQGGQADDNNITYNQKMNTSEDIDNSKQESVEKKHSPALNTLVTQQNVNKNVKTHSISTIESEINQIHC